MDDSLFDEFIHEIKQDAFTILKHEKEALVVEEHATTYDDDEQIFAFMQRLGDSCVHRFYKEQFDFLNEHVRRSEFYRQNRYFEQLNHKLHLQ